MTKVYYPKPIAKLEVLLYDYGTNRYKTPFKITLVPISVDVQKTSYQRADTFSMTVRFEDLPFDPRLARSILVHIAVVDVKSLDSFTADNFRPEHIIFSGFADTHNISLESVDRTITFEGRDYTALFIDSQFDNANLPDAKGERTQTIKLDRPVLTIIKDLMSNLPAVKNMKIRDETNGKAVKNFATSVPSYDLVNGQKSTSGQFAHINPNRTYWDAIVSICEVSGLICYVDLDELVITTPRILYQGPTTNSKRTLQMIYGNNLMKLEFNRNLGKKKKFNIVVRNFDVVTEKAIVVTIPRDATSSWSKEMNIPKKIAKTSELNTDGIRVERDAPFISFFYPDINTKEGLVSIGEKIFEEFIRQQLEGTCETHEMRVLDDKGVEFDLTKIKTGTPIKIEILLDDIQNLLRFDTKGAKIADGRRTAEVKKKIDYLKQKGYSKTVATQLINAIAEGSGKLRPTFYTREASIVMDSQGFSMRIGFVNFIQIGDFS